MSTNRLLIGPLSGPPIDFSLLPREALPTMYDLPSEDPEEPALPDAFHLCQPQLLRDTFRPPRYEPERVFAGTDLNLYYDADHIMWHQRPDWFAVLGVSRPYKARDLHTRAVLWQEQVGVYLIVDWRSPATGAKELGQTQRTQEGPPTKWEVYEQRLRVPYYAVFSRYTNRVRYFALHDGPIYHEVTTGDQRLWLPEAGLVLGLWSGVCQGIKRQWLRFYDAQGVWIPTPEEHERQRAAQADQRAARLAAQLRALGIEPEP